MALTLPIEIKDPPCTYGEWTPCQDEKCEGIEFMQTRPLLRGNPAKCTDTVQTAYGTFKPFAKAIFMGEGTEETAKEGGACPGVPWGYLYYNVPKCPQAELKSTKFTGGHGGGEKRGPGATPGNVGVNDGEYCLPNAGAVNEGSANDQNGNENPYTRNGQNWQSGNIYSDCANTTQTDDTGKTNANCDSPECNEEGGCGYNSAARGVQAHPDGNSGGGAEDGSDRKNCANGTAGCFGVYGDSYDSQGNPDGNPDGSSGSLKDALNAIKKACPPPDEGEGDGEGDDEDDNGEDGKPGTDCIPMEVSTSPGYTDKNGNPTTRTGSNEYGCPAGGRKENPPPRKANEGADDY